MIHNKGKLLLRLATLIGLLALSLSPSFGTAAPQGSKIYWTDYRQLGAKLANGDDNGMIRRANLDGSNPEDVLTELSRPVGIALDSLAGKMYWTEAPQDQLSHELATTNGTGRIRRANLDGSEVEDPLVTEVDGDDLVGPYGIALDTAAGKMYWADPEADKIQRANLDGSGAETLLDENDVTDPVDVDLDVAAGKMYWTEPGTATLMSGTGEDCTGSIKRANLDGSNVEGVWTGLCGPAGIALDIAAGKVYWTEWGVATAPVFTSVSDEPTCPGKVRRANLDGSDGIEDLVENLCRPLDIAVDVDEGKMYWSSGRVYAHSQLANTISCKIQRANLNGSGVQTLLDENDGLNQPLGIALYLAAALTVNTTGVGAGTGRVTSDPAGIFCGDDCIQHYAKGTVVTLTAHPGPKSYLASWSGACVSTGALTAEVTMDDDKTCTATFGYPVGGMVVPVDKLGLLAPWMGLVALAGLAALGVALVRRRKG
jgi:sugar lactone lactonase YvrE